MNTKKQKIGGFSINEVLVTMFVVSVGLVAVIELFAKGVINSGIDRDRVIASGLAQEGVEIVKNARDITLAKGDLNGFSFFTVAGSQHCRSDYDVFSVSLCSNSSVNSPQNNPGRYDLNLVPSGYYGHANGADTKFSRYVYVDYTSVDPKSADVIAFVYWGADIPADIETGSVANCSIGNKCVYSQLHLENWKP